MRPNSAYVAEASTDELVEVVSLVLGELAARPDPDLSAPGTGLALMHRAEDLRAALDLGSTAFACWVRAVDKAKAVRGLRFPSVKSWLKIACGMRTGRVEETVVTGTQLERLPLTEGLLRAGKLPFPVGATIAETVQRLSDEDCAKAEQIMHQWVDEGRTATQLARAGTRIKEFIAERDGTDKPPEDSRHPGEQSWWRLSKSPDGSSYVKGHFTPELTALVLDQLTRLAAPAGPHDIRDHHERLADALGTYLAGGGSNWNATLIIRLDPDTGKPTTHPKPKPGDEPETAIVFDTTNLTRRRFTDAAPPSPASTLASSVSAPPSPASPPAPASASYAPSPPALAQDPAKSQPGSGPPESGISTGSGLGEPFAQHHGETLQEHAQAVGRAPNWPWDNTRISARLADGTPISAWQARLIAANAGISLLLLDSDGIPLYLGNKTRLFTPAQRRVIEALYDTCAFTECDIPARDCQLDHVTNWSDGGPTDIDRAAPTCSYHNRLKYQHPEDIKTIRDSRGRWQYEVIYSGRRHWRTRPGRSP